MTEPFRYLSVCSGIEAASVALEPIEFEDGGRAFEAVGFAEIEKAPSRVLAHHFGSNMPGEPFPEVGIPNFGDFTKIDPRGLDVEVLIGGTPCQGYSIAGQRGGIECDPRARLTLEYVNLLERIDEERIASGLERAVAWWENVPGVLSISDNSFGHLLASLSGESEPITPGPLPPSGKSNRWWRWSKKTGLPVARWGKSGLVIGPRVAKHRRYDHLIEDHRDTVELVDVREIVRQC